MWQWLERGLHRQLEIEQGADADLFRNNRRRWKLSWSLLGCFFLLMGVQAVVALNGRWQAVAVAITMLFFVAGLLVAEWARAWEVFLDRPGPKEPPRLWKWK